MAIERWLKQVDEEPEEVNSKLKRKPYKVTRIKHDVNERLKRLGVYYMCIDDLPL